MEQSTWALYGLVGSHVFEGLVSAKAESPRIVKNLGDKMIVIMRNHGFLNVGRTVGKAFVYMRRLMMACETQIKLISTGATINPVPVEVLEHTRKRMVTRTEKKLYGEMGWPAMMRLADGFDPSFRN